MQCKSIVLVVILGISAFVSKAQYHSAIPAATRVVKSDTILVSSKPKLSCSPYAVAANMPCIIPGRSKQAQLPVTPAVKKDVPLAGESYYGTMNDYVTDFVRKYMSAHNRTLSTVQGKSLPHFSLMDNVLKQHDIPKQLKYLAVIESALNNKAISRAGAVGPWQLMAPTARLMGLTVGRGRDDRKDWYKSTNAAAKYLTYLYSNLDDWLLVVAAYNSGPAPVQRAIARTGSHNFWDIKQYLPRETQGHVLAFIATATIFENLSSFIGIGTIPTDFAFGAKGAANAVATAVKGDIKPTAINKPAFNEEELKNMAIVRLKEPLSFDLLELELKIDKKLLNKWNPDYELFVYDTYNADYYSLRIPKDKLESFVAKKDYLTRKSREVLNNQNQNM